MAPGVVSDVWKGAGGGCGKKFPVRCSYWEENGGQGMLLIRSGYVIDPGSGMEGVRDILVDGRKIMY